MSIYIKGMEMPKGCEDCFFFTESCGGICRISQGEGCPLIPVPPHGRLIDADALEEEGTDVHADIIHCGYVEDTICGFSHDMIYNAPTIVPANKKEYK